MPHLQDHCLTDPGGLRKVISDTRSPEGLSRKRCLNRYRGNVRLTRCIYRSCSPPFGLYTPDIFGLEGSDLNICHLILSFRIKTFSLISQHFVVSPTLWSMNVITSFICLPTCSFVFRCSWGRIYLPFLWYITSSSLTLLLKISNYLTICPSLGPFLSPCWSCPYHEGFGMLLHKVDGWDHSEKFGQPLFYFWWQDPCRSIREASYREFHRLGTAAIWPWTHNSWIASPSNCLILRILSLIIIIIKRERSI